MGTCHKKIDKKSIITNDMKLAENMTNDVFDFSDETKEICDEKKEYSKNTIISSEAENFEEYSKESVHEDQEKDQFASSTQKHNLKQENKHIGNRYNNNPRMKNVSSHKKRVVLPPRESNSRPSRQRVSYAELDDHIENFVESDEELIPY